MPVPNLDRLGQTALFEFSERHQNGSNYKLLFDSVDRNTIPDTGNLARYADCLFARRELEKAGYQPEALVRKLLGENYYSALSPKARWR